jgi:hypothetical protein
MLIRPALIDRLAETLEGIAMTNAGTTGQGHAREASVLVYHAGRPAAGGPLAGESPLLEINLSESDSSATVIVNSALGMIELHGIDEIRLLEVTEEAAFYSRESPGKISVLTLSSRGVIQVYMNIAESLQDAELADIADSDLRAAVALKIFAENAEVFRNSDE